MKTTSLISLFFTLFLFFLLNSCSIFSPVKVENTNTYLLKDTPYVSKKTKRHHAMTLVVLMPEANAAYRTVEMAYSVKPYQIAYFAKNRWAAMPSQMLQPLIIQTLQNTHYFHAVVSPSFLSHYDYALKTQILELQQDFTFRPILYRLSVHAQLINANGHVIASKQFDEVVPVSQANPYAGVIAANEATVNMLRELSLFCLHSLH